MSAKHNTPVSVNTDSYCQHISAKGRRCHMLIDKHHRPPNGEKRPPLCVYHANSLKASTPAPDPEVIAAELLGSIEDFATADAVNLFLGNLLKQLARKRIARRDAIALAYLCQLLLNSLPALRRESEDELDASAGRFLTSGLLRSGAASLDERQANDTAEREAIPVRQL
jgi:hypothetical protein